MNNAKNKRIMISVIVIAVATIAGWMIGDMIYDAQKKAEDMKIVPISARDNYLNTSQSIANAAKSPLETMIAAAEKDRVCLVVVSGYRSKERQQKVYDEAVDKSIVAKPGTSEHETGLAVDLGACPMNTDGVRDDSVERPELKNDFNTLPEYQWLVKNAYKYGFSQSYTEENSKEKGFPVEPWHWKYNY